MRTVTFTPAHVLSVEPWCTGASESISELLANLRDMSDRPWAESVQAAPYAPDLIPTVAASPLALVQAEIDAAVWGAL